MINVHQGRRSKLCACLWTSLLAGAVYSERQVTALSKIHMYMVQISHILNDTLVLHVVLNDIDIFMLDISSLIYHNITKIHNNCKNKSHYDMATHVYYFMLTTLWLSFDHGCPLLSG